MPAPGGWRSLARRPDDAVTVRVNEGTAIEAGGKRVRLGALRPGMRVSVTDAVTPPPGSRSRRRRPRRGRSSAELLYNFRHNLFKPLLLFFYMGFLVPILRVKFEFPYVIYQGLTIYLLIAIGWHGGEELAAARAERRSARRRASWASAS